MAENRESAGWVGIVLMVIGGLLVASVSPVVGGFAVLFGCALVVLKLLPSSEQSVTQIANTPEENKPRAIETLISWLTPEVETALVEEMVRISTLTVHSAQIRFDEWQRLLLAKSKTGSTDRFEIEVSIEDSIRKLALRVLREGPNPLRPYVSSQQAYSIAREEALLKRRSQDQRKKRPKSTEREVKMALSRSVTSHLLSTQDEGTSSRTPGRQNVSLPGPSPAVDEFSVDPSQQGAELFRLMQLLPGRGHWGIEIRPVRAAGGDYLVWHIDEPVRRAAQGQELWSGDQSVLAFLQSILEDGDSSAKLAEVVLTTCKVESEDKPVPVLELHLRSNNGGPSSVIGRTPLVSNGINYLPGRLQTVNGFRGANDLIARTGYVLLNCDNVEDLGAYWQRLEMRLLAAARVEV